MGLRELRRMCSIFWVSVGVVEMYTMAACWRFGIPEIRTQHFSLPAVGGDPEIVYNFLILKIMFKNNVVRLTGLVTSYVETAFYNKFLKER